MKRIKLNLQRWIHDKSFYLQAAARRKKNVALKREIDLNGKKAVIFGVATDKSLAWNVAKTLNDNGCRIALGYQERAAEYVRELSLELDQPLLCPCDMVSDELIGAFFERVKVEFGSFDYLIHSVAFTKKQFLEGRYLEIDRKGFALTQDVSVYSLTALVKAAEQLLNNDGRVLTMTYLGSSRALPNYNVMGVAKAALEASVRYLSSDLGSRGITVNAISAGPVKTLAAAAIGDFDRMLELAAERAPLKRNIQPQDVADLALFLCSDLACNITGQVMFVDAGFSSMV